MPRIKTQEFPLPGEKALGKPGSLAKRMNRLAGAPPARFILGIDPGLVTTGYGLIEIVPQPQRAGERIATSAVSKIELVDAGTIKACATDTLPERLKTLFEGLTEVLDEYKPEAVVIEELFSTYAHPRSALLMAHARGVLMLAAGQTGAPVYTFLPNEIKQVISGNGHATKGAMQAAVRQRLGLAANPEPHDVADALAIALCFAARQDLGQRLG